jgi:hypothetical protein
VKHSQSLLFVGFFACSVSACQGEVSLGNNDQAVKPDSKPPKGQSCQGNDPEWTELLRGSWSLDPGEEVFYCVRKTIDEDAYLGAARGTHALGTHDAVLSAGAPTGPDGLELCNDELPGQTAIMTSPSGTHEVEAAEGAAVLLSAGQQVVLRVHAFNTSTQLLVPESLQQVKSVPAASVTVVREALDLGLLPEHELEAPADASCGSHTDLITHEWELAPGSEQHVCVRQTLTNDVTFTDIQALTPLGTHSVVLSAGAPVVPDGIDPACDPAASEANVIFGAAEGNHRLTSPDGFGVHIGAGTQLLLNLHVVNVTPMSIGGTAGFRVR